MKIKTLSPILAVLTVALLGLAPTVAAHPITPSLSWNLSHIPLLGSTVATASVAIDTDCPSGQTFSGTITVTEPDGVSVGTFSVGPTPCGSSVTATYPTDFSGTASTSENGAYTATFAGTTSQLVGGQYPKFSLTDSFIAGTFPPPPTVPQFSAPALLVVAASLMLVAVAKKGKLLPF